MSPSLKNIKSILLLLSCACLALLTTASNAQTDYSLHSLEQQLNPQANTAKAFDIEEKIHRIKLDRLNKEIAWLSADVSSSSWQNVRSTTSPQNFTTKPVKVNHAGQKTHERSLASLRRIYVSFWIAQQRQSVAKKLLSIETDLRRFVSQKQNKPQQQQLVRKLFSALEMARRSVNSDYEISQLSLLGLKELTTGHIPSFKATPPRLSAACLSDRETSPVVPAAWTRPANDQEDRQIQLQHDYQLALLNRSEAESRFALAAQTYSEVEGGIKIEHFTQQLEEYRAAINLIETENVLLSTHIALLAQNIDKCSESDKTRSKSTEYETIILSKLRNGKWASKLDLEPLSTPKREPKLKTAAATQSKSTLAGSLATQNTHVSSNAVITEPVQASTAIVVTAEKRSQRDHSVVRVHYELLYPHPKATRNRVRYE